MDLVVLGLVVLGLVRPLAFMALGEGLGMV